MKSSILRVTLSKLVGLMIFLIVLFILNALRFPNPIAKVIVNFLNQNAWIIIIISLLLYLGELFELFVFPFNLPYPLFNAIGGSYLAIFIVKMIGLFSGFKFILYFGSIISLIVFLVVVIVGYMKIFLHPVKHHRRHKNRRPHKKEI